MIPINKGGRDTREAALGPLITRFGTRLDNRPISYRTHLSGAPRYIGGLLLYVMSTKYKRVKTRDSSADTYRDFGGEVVRGNIFADHYDLFAADRYGENIVIYIRDLSIPHITTGVQISVFITNNACINHDY